ncbi:MAG: nucleoside hydrolase [Candidatus Aminicenantes bacterium]|nr:nucleoside hydrolase [Candidatus Aminicenantes bacterium]
MNLQTPALLISTSRIHSKSYQTNFRILIAFFLIICSFTGLAHSGKAKYHVIIDTDGALDDLRALCLFLASADFEIQAITTSDGVLSPAQALEKVHSLLEHFGHEGIPTGMGSTVLENAPPWRPLNRSISWSGPDSDLKSFRSGPQHSTSLDSVPVIRDALENENDPVIFVCLGSLTNLAEIVRTAPNFLKRIERVVWYVDNIDPLSGTNFDFDREAARIVLESPLRIEAVTNSGAPSFIVDKAFLAELSGLDSRYSPVILTSHSTPDVNLLLERGHLQFWDDLIPVYLLYPGLFTGLPVGNTRPTWMVSIKDRATMKEWISTCYAKILTDRNRVRSKVFDGFPEKADLFAPDVRPLMTDIIQRHGREEWRLGVLTNELHGHLGIYAVIGTKMGLRAREFFHIGIDDISVFSLAGKIPPLSCMNDGLQVSTGSTVGHGLFSVRSEPPFVPEASFTFKNRTVHLKLKDELWSIIRKDIREGIERFGLNTEPYWRHVRELALRYWRDWDRMEIFEINPLS